jgi:hypothetical protein
MSPITIHGDPLAGDQVLRGIKAFQALAPAADQLAGAESLRFAAVQRRVVDVDRVGEQLLEKFPFASVDE